MNATLLGNFPWLICLTGIIGVVGCQDKDLKSVWWQTEREEAALRSEIKVAKLRLQRFAPEANSYEFESLKSKYNAELSRAEFLRERQSLLRKQVSGITDSMAELQLLVKNQYRGKSVGTFYETFTLPSGKVYQKVTIMTVDDTGVVISHEGGIARILPANLSPSQCYAFVYQKDLGTFAEKASGPSPSQQDPALFFRKDIP